MKYWIAFVGIAGPFGGCWTLIAYQERSQVFEGTWLYQFEGSSFTEAIRPGRECDLYKEKLSRLAFDPSQIYRNYDYKKLYPSSGYTISKYGPYPLHAFVVRFVGRKELIINWMGEYSRGPAIYRIEKMLSAKPIPGLICHIDTRQS